MRVHASGECKNAYLRVCMGIGLYVLLPLFAPFPPIPREEGCNDVDVSFSRCDGNDDDGDDGYYFYY